MLKYSSQSAHARAFLLRQFNDIDIYVEDTSCHNMWTRILVKTLPANIKLTSVIQVGGREEVIAACKQDPSNSKRKRLYIIDGDFDFLLGRPKPRHKNLYRLRSYCVENLIYSDNAILEVASEYATNIPINSILSQLDPKKLEDEIAQSLTSLFIIYAVAHELVPSIQTVGYSVFHLGNSSTPQAFKLCPAKIQLRMLAISREVIDTVGRPIFSRTLNAVRNRAAKLSTGMIISGKDYILKLLLWHLRHQFSYRGDENILKVRLANEYDPISEPYFKRTLHKICS